MRIKKILCKTVAVITTAAMLTGYGSVLDTEASEYESDSEEVVVIEEETDSEETSEDVTTEEEAEEVLEVVVEDETTEETSEAASQATETSSEEETKSASLMASSTYTSGDYIYRILDDGTISIASYSGDETELEIPSTIDGYTVTVIEVLAFGSSSTSIKIPDSVTTIEESAFRNCAYLTTFTVDSASEYFSAQDGVLYNKDKTELVCCPAGKSGSFTVPSGVESIGDSAFHNCKSLTSIKLPDSVTSIGDYAFDDCWDVTSIEIPDSVTSIGIEAFNSCYELTSINIPAGVTSIGEGTFLYCESLTDIEIPDSVTSIGGNAFDYCTELTSINIPAGVTSIGNGAFGGTHNLTNIAVDSDNQYYSSQDGVLYNKDKTELISCPGGISSLSVPYGVTTIDEAAFETCVTLTSITLPDSVKTIGDFAFFNCARLKSINIPDSVTSIGEHAFEDCNRLERVYLSDSMTCISSGLFEYCESLVSIYIPDSVTSIGWAFYDSGLADIYYSGSEDQWNNITFDENWDNGLPEDVEIHYNVSEYNLSYATMEFAENEGYNYDYDVTTFDYDHTSCYTYYNGSAKEPEIIVTSVTGNILTLGTDYTITYSNNTNAGTATVTVKGIGNYSGTITGTFTINKNSQYITASAASSTITGVGKTTTITASTNGDGAITYSSSNTSVATVDSTGKVTAKGYGTATITVTAAETSNCYVSTKTITINVKLAKPTLKSTTNTTSGVKVTWSAVTGATKYQVYRKTSGGSWAKLGTSTSTSYTDKTAKSGTTYYYTVRCMNSSGTYTSDYNTSGISKKYLSKGKISSLTNKSSGITIKWSKVTGASGYYIYRKTSSGSYSKIKTITSGPTLSYTDTGVKSKNGTTYVYKVVPYSGSTIGSFTAKTTVRLTGTTLSSVKNSSSKKMTVKWSKKSSITGYQIQYSTSSSFSSYKTVTVSGASKVSKVISSLTKNKTYYVRIRTYKTVSGTKYYSAWSSKKSVKIKK